VKPFLSADLPGCASQNTTEKSQQVAVYRSLWISFHFSFKFGLCNSPTLDFLACFLASSLTYQIRIQLECIHTYTWQYRILQISSSF